MYVFAHNAESGEHATVSESIHGEDLPFIFGAPLGDVGPFQVFYNAEERLLSEAVMRYFTNFAKTGKPTVPWSGRFHNMNPIDWEKYDVDWQEFNDINQNYLLLGIPPIVSQRYRHKYTKFWNEGLIETMKNANSQFGVYGKFQNTPPTPRKFQPAMPTGSISMYPIKVEIEGETDDPVRELRHRLQQTRNSVHSPSLSVSTESINYEQISSDEHEIFKSETTTILLIAVIVAFLLVNLMGLLIYLYRRKKLKYNNTNIFDDDKRSKFNDTDDSFILRKSNNTYESVKRHSPINGFGMSRQLSTSTVDTHMKVSDWISSEIPRNIHQNSFARREKVSVAIDATPQARSNSILRQEPIEVTKAKSSMDYGNCGRIVCQEVDMDGSMIDEIPFREFRERTESDSSECSSFDCEECAINHQHSYSDPARNIHYVQEEVTSFIELSDVNVTSRDESEKIPLSPEESLKVIQKMNCPKVLPSYPDNLQFNDSSKRRSLQIPPQFYQIHNNNTLLRDSSKLRPNPPPRLSSTLERRTPRSESKANLFMSKAMKAVAPPTPPDPEITSSSITVGPIVPKLENIYMSMQRKASLSRQNSIASQIVETPEKPSLENPPNQSDNEHLYAEIIKNTRVQMPQDGIYSITAGAASKQLQATNSQESNSNSTSSSEESSTGTIREIN